MKTCCGYSLKVPQRGTSNVYPQHTFSWRNKKNVSIFRLSCGPYFSYYSYFSLLFFLCSYFSLLFSENALLSLLFRPKMFEVTKNCNFFPRLLEVCKNWINLIRAFTMQKFMKCFYFSCNSFFGTFILVFPYHGDIVLLFRENCFLILSFFKPEINQNILTIPTFHDFNSYFCPTFSNLSPTLSLLFH